MIGALGIEAEAHLGPFCMQGCHHRLPDQRVHLIIRQDRKAITRSNVAEWIFKAFQH